MPGIVLEVRVAVGDRVVPGQTLVVLEAMKMEHRMTAQVEGVVTEVHVVAGQQVDNGAVLLVIEEGSDGEERDG
jgi:propionyl-CoA carboxylase alpha chain